MNFDEMEGALDTLKVKFMRSAQGEYKEMETEITVNAAKK